MKKLWLSFSFYLVFILLPGITFSIQAASPPIPHVALTENALARGAATPNELAQNLIKAIQENNFAGLNAFLLEDKEMVLLKSKGSEDMKAFLENTAATDLQRTFRQSYQELINQGITQTINWSDYVLSEARLEKGSAKNTSLQPLTIVLTGKQNHHLELLLETIKLNNRYFLFRQIELKQRKKI